MINQRFREGFNLSIFSIFQWNIWWYQARPMLRSDVPADWMRLSKRDIFFSVLLALFFTRNWKASCFLIVSSINFLESISNKVYLNYIMHADIMGSPLRFLEDFLCFPTSSLGNSSFLFVTVIEFLIKKIKSQRKTGS